MKTVHFDAGVYREVCELGQYERSVQIEPGDKVLDLGCSKGYLFWKHQSKGIDYLGVDASIACLADFISALEADERPRLLNCAVSSAGGVHEAGSLFHDGRHFAATVTWSELIKAIGGAIDFLKFDIEGFEVELLEGVNYEQFKLHVRKFAGELHFSGKWVNRDRVVACLKRLKEDPEIHLRLFALDGLEITESYWGRADHFREIIATGTVSPANPFRAFYDGVMKRDSNVIACEQVNFHCVNGAFVEVLATTHCEYDISFVDRQSGECLYQTKLRENQWAKTTRQYYTDWRVTVVREDGKTVVDRCLDLREQRVFVCIDSKALGDTLAWIPFTEEFRNRHGCRMVVSTFWNGLFREAYPEIEFVEPGTTVPDLLAQYTVGCRTPSDRNFSPWPWHEQPLQAVAAGILGLPFREIRPRLAFDLPGSPMATKYVCIATESTAPAKHWQHVLGWEVLVRWLTAQGFDVVNVSRDGRVFQGARTLPNGPIETVAWWLKHAEIFIGLPSGLSWLAWALERPVVMISGFSPSWVEFQNNRVHVGPPAGFCQGCYAAYPKGFDMPDLKLCPRLGGTPRQLECTKSISPESVISAIKQLIDKPTKLNGALK